jgi:hypothetical protein
MLIFYGADREKANSQGRSGAEKAQVPAVGESATTDQSGRAPFDCCLSLRKKTGHPVAHFAKLQKRLSGSCRSSMPCLPDFQADKILILRRKIDQRNDLGSQICCRGVFSKQQFCRFANQRMRTQVSGLLQRPFKYMNIRNFIFSKRKQNTGIKFALMTCDHRASSH